MNNIVRFAHFFIVIIWIMLAIGCNGPCDDLAEQICECQTGSSAFQKETCIQQHQLWIDEASDEGGDMDKKCEEVLKLGSCEKLATFDYTSLGMTRVKPEQ